MRPLILGLLVVATTTACGEIVDPRPRPGLTDELVLYARLMSDSARQAVAVGSADDADPTLSNVTVRLLRQAPGQKTARWNLVASARTSTVDSLPGSPCSYGLDYCLTLPVTVEPGATYKVEAFADGHRNDPGRGKLRDRTGCPLREQRARGDMDGQPSRPSLHDGRDALRNDLHRVFKSVAHGDQRHKLRGHDPTGSRRQRRSRAHSGRVRGGSSLPRFSDHRTRRATLQGAAGPERGGRLRRRGIDPACQPTDRDESLIRAATAPSPVGERRLPLTATTVPALATIPYESGLAGRRAGLQRRQSRVMLQP